MSVPVYHPEAEVEATEAAEWFEREQPGLGANFRVELDAAVERITASPESFGFLSSDVRCHRMHRFPYGVLYQVYTERVFILAVMHLHREPEYWKDRL